MNVAAGFAYYRLGPWMSHSLQLMGLTPQNPFHRIVFFAATDVLHSVPTLPLRNSATHRILEAKPIEGVCLRLRSGPEAVSRTAAEHLDSATRSFRGLRMFVLEKFTYHFTFAVTTTVVRAAVSRQSMVPSLGEYPMVLEGIAVFAAGFASYPFKLMRNFMVVSEMDEAAALDVLWQREGTTIQKLWSGFGASVPQLLLQPLYLVSQHAAEIALVKRYGYGMAIPAELGSADLPPPPGLASAQTLYSALLDFGRSNCGVVLWNRPFVLPDLPASACGMLPLIGIVRTTYLSAWGDVVCGLSLEQYYTVFALGTLLETAWKVVAWVG
mmetsp:Transcript_29877/g.89332  ORF Transcript_29877/g.89332 Transcript_29877/m.89332 type:complete len:326 (+) Transcript_29877:232-1209(+)